MAERRLTVRFKVKDLVITEENQGAFIRVIGLTAPQPNPQCLYLEGPGDSGKTTLMVARGTDRDFMSQKRSMYCHAAEILLAIRLDNYSAEEHLADMGEVGLLFIDNLEGFLEDVPLGPQACKMLIETRKNAGLDTVVSARIPMKDFPDPDIKEALQGFEVVGIPSLSSEGRVLLARNMLVAFARSAGKVVNASPSALEAIANGIARDCGEIEPIIQRIVADAPEGRPLNIEKEDLRILLA